MADPYTTPIPGASGYESATLAAKTAYQNALTRLNQQRGDTLRQYGYSGSIDPTTGTVTNVAVDPNLPYGEYQQERKAHADAYQAQRDASQSRGLGSGGLAQQGIDQLRYGFGAEDAALGSGLSSALSGFQDQQNQAKYAQDSALSDAELQATRDAIQQQMFNQANLDGLDVPQGPDWGSIIAGLLGGDGSGDGSGDGTGDNGTTDTSGPGQRPAPNSKKSGASLYSLLNPKPKAPDALSRFVANKPAPKPKAAPKPAAKPAPPKPAPKPAAKPAPKKKKGGK